jgi:hypothetical protein
MRSTSMRSALLILVTTTGLCLPGRAAADTAAVPESCRAAIEVRWPEWRLSPPPRDFAAYARQQRVEPNVVLADFDGDDTRDAAVLLLTSATRRAQRRLAICVSRGGAAELHVVRDPYCGDGITLVPKGTNAWDFERDVAVTHQANGVRAVCFEKAGATYLLVNGRLVRVVDSD